MDEVAERKRVLVQLDLQKLENATIIYDETTDTLYVNMDEEEADEVIMLENNVIVRIKRDTVIGLSIQGVTRYSR